MFCISFQTPQIATTVTNNDTVQEIEKSKYISKFVSQYLSIQEKRIRIPQKDSQTQSTQPIQVEEVNNTVLVNPIVISYSVPNIDSNFKTYTDYRMINGTGTGQLDIKNNSYTDELGLRRLNETDEYVIALGSYYCQSAGEHFIITLDTGIVLNCVSGDTKDDTHTNSTSQYITKNGNIVEFHIDSRVASKDMLLSGTISYYDQFKGSIVGIQKVLQITP